MVLIRSWRSLTKKDSVKEKQKFYFNSSFTKFFSRIRIIPDWIRIFGWFGFLADPDPDSGKKSDPDPG